MRISPIPAGGRNEAIAGWTMAAPAAAGLALFILLPFALAAVLSFTSYRFNSPLGIRWIGIENFARLLGDTGFRHAFWNNMQFTAAVVPLQTALALGLALLVNRPLKRMLFFRTVFFMPVIYPMALVSAVWALLLAPGPAGLMNQLLRAITFGAWQPADFLHHPAFAMISIIAMSVWQGAGYQMVILLAGLQSIPAELYEAAAIDRASRRQQFLHVTLPQLRGTLVFVIMLTTILAFRLFDQVWILTQGGPQDATTTMLFEAFVAARERNQVGLGSAMSVVFFSIVCAVAVAQHLLSRRERRPQ